MIKHKCDSFKKINTEQFKKMWEGSTVVVLTEFLIFRTPLSEVAQ